ncbi:MAG: hypothetical protein J4F37_06985 [Acidobacteria bacterium]|nr:hypothetical protein [Acidobacteriota bacterium]
MAGATAQTPRVPPARPPIERRLVAALGAAPSRIPVVLGGCGSGRTSLLRRIARHLATRGGSQYIDVEGAGSTPEGFLAAVTADSPYATGDDPRLFRAGRRNARDAFDALLRFLGRPARGAATPAFLIDGLLELRTFESFPGLRGVLGEFLDALEESPNRFALASRYVSRTLRMLRGRPDRFEVIHLPRLSPTEVTAALAAHRAGRTDAERNDLGRVVHALADGRPVYVDRLAAALATGEAAPPADVLAAQLAPGAPLYWICRFSYELRLHRARGYGALKAILAVLADEEPLTLTAIAVRLGRTPGSTRDYLSWLEDVDMIGVRQKRFSFVDPLLRLWVRLHCRPSPPEGAVLAREVQEYAASRLPHAEAAPSPAAGPAAAAPEPARRPRKSWGLIEID